MIFTRDLTNQSLLNVLDLEITSYDPIKELETLKLFYSFLAYDKYIEPVIIPVDHLYAFKEVPDRYVIQTTLKRIAIFVKANDESTTQRFIWSNRYNNNEKVFTLEIKQDSLVFIEVLGDVLSYADGNKLIFVEPICNMNHPITLLFVDNFGLPQSTVLEIGSYVSSNEVTNKFKSISGELEYPLEIIPNNKMTIGNNQIPKELREFYAGLVNSRTMMVLLDSNVGNDFIIKALPTVLSDASLNADNFTKHYNISGVLSFNTKDMSDLSMHFGEVNIHNV